MTGIQPISRRSAVRGAALAAVAALAGFAAARSSSAATRGAFAAANGYGPASVGTGGRRLVPVAQVPPGGGVVVAAADVVLTKDPTGAVHAFSATCTHQGCTVSSVSAGQIHCPCHGSAFNAFTGAVVAGPAPRSLPTVRVSVRAGVVYLG